MSDLKGSKTHENLKNAFARASQVNRLYLYFAKDADVQGHPDIAGLFKDSADGTTGHAHGHLDYIKSVGDPLTEEPVGSTEKNLKSALAETKYSYEQLYPNFAKIAREEGFEDIAEWFETLSKAYRSHNGRFTKAIQTLEF